MRAAWLSVAWAAGVAVTGAAAQPAALPENVRVEATGTPGGGGEARGSVDVPATPEAVWATMVDCPGAPRFVPNLLACRVLEGDPAGRWDVREHTLQGPFGRVRHVFRTDYERPRAMRSARTAGDLKSADGDWRIDPIPGGSRVSFRSRIVLNGPVPGVFVRQALRRDMRATLRALRAEVIARGD